VKSLWVSWLFFTSFVTFADLQFTDAVFNRLDLSEIRTLQKNHPQEQTLLKYFEAESLYFGENLDASEKILDSLRADCLQSKKKTVSPKEQGLCLMALVGFSSKPTSLRIHLKSKWVQKWLQALQEPSLSFEERVYVEGRVLWKLPEAFGGNFKKSVVALESLRRLRPDCTSSLFFLGQIYSSEGKTELAEAIFQKALESSPPDYRTAVYLKKKNQTAWESGFYFGVVSNPAGGSGFLVGRREDGIGNSNRRVDVSIAAQSRGVYSGNLFFEDNESLSDIQISLFLGAATEIDQYFGLGPSSQLGSLTELDQTKSVGKLSFTKHWYSGYLRIGPAWMYRDVSSIRGPFSSTYLRERQASVFPRVTLGWSHRNQTKIEWSGQASWTGFLSTHDFQTMEGVIEQELLKLGSSRFKGLTRFRWCSRSCPFGILSEVSGNLLLPGVRSGRYRERTAWSGSLQWIFPILDEISGNVFANGAMLSPEISKITQSRFLSGGGIALLVGRGSFQSRLELGHFNGENLIQIGLQTSYQ